MECLGAERVCSCCAPQSVYKVSALRGYRHEHEAKGKEKNVEREQTGAPSPYAISKSKQFFWEASKHTTFFFVKRCGGFWEPTKPQAHT